MTLRHTVIWDIDPAADPAVAEKAFEALAALLSVIPEVQDFLAGPNMPRDWEPTKRRFGITMIFASMDDFHAYTQHPNVAKALTAIRPYNANAMQIQVAM